MGIKRKICSDVSDLQYSFCLEMYYADLSEEKTSARFDIWRRKDLRGHQRVSAHCCVLHAAATQACSSAPAGAAYYAMECPPFHCFDSALCLTQGRSHQSSALWPQAAMRGQEVVGCVCARAMTHPFTLRPTHATRAWSPPAP